MRALVHAHAEAVRRRMPRADVLGEMTAARVAVRRERERTRVRRPLGVAEATPSGGAAPSAAGTPARASGAAAGATASATAPRIVIVGAGLAGLRCAHRLWTASPALRSTVYEAATDHIGGRCWSLRGFFANGLVAEHGGSFINDDESAIRELATSLGLEEVAVNGGDLPGHDEVFWIDGASYSYEEANADWNAIGHRVFSAANGAAPWPQTCFRHTAEGRRLDRLNVLEWLDEVGIGALSRFGRLLQMSAVAEFGGDPADQSALSLLSLLPSGNGLSLDPIPGYDEKFVIVGGNDQIASRMVDALPHGTIQPGHRLVHVARAADGTYRCTFDTPGGTITTIADYLVLTIPFRMLREVDLSQAGFSPRKMAAIRELGFGSLGKIHVQLSSKPWVPLHYAGGAYSDPRSFGVVWDDSVALGPAAAPALMTIYPGAGVCDSRLTRPVGAAHGMAPPADVDWFFGEIEHIYPRLRPAYMGIAFEDNWPNSPHHRGALAYWRPGQHTGFAGWEGVREGNALFAGEHTNPDAGFMNSAIVSGERAARTIRRAIRVRSL
jgi:monoamine oxidase